MEKNQVLETIKLVREFSKKRNFNQAFDLIITLKNLNLKKQEENVDLFLNLPHSRGKQLKICALVDDNLEAKAKIFDHVVNANTFKKYEDPKLAKKLASSYDLFIAQANLMGQIATAFGKILGPKGKMPNPKSGAVVLPTADMEALKIRFSKLVRLQTKKEPIIKTSIGSVAMKDEDISANILAAYNALVHALPQEQGNIKEVMLKLTMSPRVKLGETKEQVTHHLSTIKKYNKEKKQKKPKKSKVKEDGKLQS